MYARISLVNCTHGAMTQVKLSELVTHPSHPDASRQTLRSCSPPSATWRRAAPSMDMTSTSSSETHIRKFDVFRRSKRMYLSSKSQDFKVILQVLSNPAVLHCWIAISTIAK
jgi:hypothetical protein